MKMLVFLFATIMIIVGCGIVSAQGGPPTSHGKAIVEGCVLHINALDLDGYDLLCSTWIRSPTTSLIEVEIPVRIEWNQSEENIITDRVKEVAAALGVTNVTVKIR